MYFEGIIDSLAISLDWETAQSFLDDPSVRLQLLLMAGLICVTFIATRLTKWRIHPLAENPDSPPLWRKIWAALERMVAPLFLLSLCLLTVIVFYEYHTPTHDLIRPFTSVAGAWGIFRLVSGFIKSRAWLRLVAVVAFGVAALHSFGLLGATVDLLRKLGFSIGSTEISALDLLNGIGILLGLLWGTSMLATAGETRIRQLPHLPPSLQVLLGKIMRIGLVFFSFAVALSTVGLDLSSFALLGGAVGVGIGFGLQKVVSNLVSGLILLLDRSIKPGDVIEIDGTYGWINSLRARYASVITRDGKEHLIPNENLITNKVINWTFSDKNVRVRVPIGISYDSDPRQAIDLCLDAARSIPRIINSPEPRCLVTGFGDNSVDIELRFWIEDPSNGVGNVRSELLLAVWDRFREGGIEIPFPQQDIHVRGLPKEFFPEHKTGTEPS